jgi:hypothetical protein
MIVIADGSNVYAVTESGLPACFIYFIFPLGKFLAASQDPQSAPDCRHQASFLASKSLFSK